MFNEVSNISFNLSDKCINFKRRSFEVKNLEKAPQRDIQTGVIMVFGCNSQPKMNYRVSR